MTENFEIIGDIGNGKYKFTNFIHQSGSFGKVCKIKRKNDGKIMVWKELNYGKMS